MWPTTAPALSACAPWKPLFFRGIHKVFRAWRCAMSNFEQFVAQ
jgi:hypothetical protein